MHPELSARRRGLRATTDLVLLRAAHMPEEVLHVALEVDAVRAVVVVGAAHAEGVEQVADHLRDYVQAKRVLAEVAQRAAAPLAPARVVDQGVEQAATRTRRCENSTQRERRSQALVGRSPEDPTGNAGGPEAEGQRPHILPAPNVTPNAQRVTHRKKSAQAVSTEHFMQKDLESPSLAWLTRLG